MANIKLPKGERRHVLVRADKNDPSLLELDADLVRRLYKAHGAVLFRGFDLNIQIFGKITQRFCTHSAFNESPGRTMIDRKNNVQSVDNGEDAFPLHPEMSRLPWKPDACWFGCLVAPTVGCETTVCDGVELVRKLPASVRKAFEKRRLRYRIEAQKSFLQFWYASDDPGDEALANPPADCPFTFEREDGVIYCIFTAPALHEPMFTKERAWGNFLFFSRYLHDLPYYPCFEDGSKVPDELVSAVKKVADRLEIPLKWQAKDLLLLDNTRFMHGRRAILPDVPRLILTYFGYINFAEPGAEEPANAIWRDPERWKLAL